MTYVYHDGGRAAAGYKGYAGDCVVRALTIANSEDYGVVYGELAHLMREMPRKARGKTTPRDGVPMPLIHHYLGARGWTWVPTMMIGQGCKVHLRADELPEGRLIARVTRHICAVIDGAIYDTFDPSRDGTRCVYGYWQPAMNETAA